jgi:hypothetical protein
VSEAERAEAYRQQCIRRQQALADRERQLAPDPAAADRVKSAWQPIIDAREQPDTACDDVSQGTDPR